MLKATYKIRPRSCVEIVVEVVVHLVTVAKTAQERRSLSADVIH